MPEDRYSFTTRARFFLNKLLAPVGIEILTKTEENKKTAHFNKLKNKGHWQERKYFRGLNFNEEKYFHFLSEISLFFKGHPGKLPFNEDPDKDSLYYLNNKWFGSVDAEVLYTIIRNYKPQNIVEVGSGFSTRLMRKAISDGDLKTKVICIDPQPRVDILEHANEHFALVVEDLSPDKILSKLKENDILFIDSSHEIATGGDVNYLFLEILPQLPAGVLIHIHDIFIPLDYPEEWVVHERWGWNEQYLVQTFLMYNDTFEIIWPSHYMWIVHNDKLHEIFRPPVNNYKPSSLWIKKIK